MPDQAPDFFGRLQAGVTRGLRLVKNELTDLLRPDRFVQRTLLLFCAFQLLGVLWDQPGFYGWENDGAAPRDFFGGIADNLVPGKTHRYPLFHYFLIGLLTTPVLLVDVVTALLTGTPILDVVVSTPSMTAISVSVKLLHLLMTCVGLLAMARVFRTLFGDGAARWGLLLAITNLSVAYYGRVTNVDTAYLMWVVLAIDRILLIAREGSMSQYRWFAFFVAAAVATKDQAYASFALTGPLFLLVLPWVRPAQFAASKQHFARLLRAVLWGALFYGLLSGALFNPTGFVARLEMLTGTNSQDWRQYERSFNGLMQNIADLWRLQDEFWWPMPVVITAWAGVLLAPLLRKQDNSAPATGHWLWAWLPVTAGFSNTLAFTLVVARAEHRFVLVLGYWLSGYGGALIASLLSALQKKAERATPSAVSKPQRTWAALRVAACGGAAVLVGLGLTQNIELLVTQWCDPRRDVESFLAKLPEGSRVETYGLGVYLPRFELGDQAVYTTTRVGAPEWGRPPRIAGMIELQDDFRNVTKRAPDVLVLPEGFANRFRLRSEDSGATAAMDRYRAAEGATEFFPRLLKDELPGYRLSTIGKTSRPRWYASLGGRLLQIHGSTGNRVWVLVQEK